MRGGGYGGNLGPPNLGSPRKLFLLYKNIMKYFLSVVAIFKNEKDIISEWIEHYLAEGADHFYLIDNDSTDNYKSNVNRYVKENILDIVVDNQPHMQEAHYNSYYLDKVKRESDWVMVVDLDEFIYGRGKYKTISSYLRTLPCNIAQIYVPWKIFGSNGIIYQPHGCIDNYVTRTKYNHIKTNGMTSNDTILTKTITKTVYLKRLSIHYSLINKQDNLKEITSDGQIISQNVPNQQMISEEILEKSALHCNHYPIQSFEWYRQIKMTRGSATSTVNDKVRTISYYNSFDSHGNQVTDSELSDKRNNLRAYYGVEQYVDVTRQLCKNFLDKSGKKISIGGNVQFNQYFGDPTPGKSKYLLIRCKHQLMVYPETGHGQIEINL